MRLALFAVLASITLSTSQAITTSTKNNRIILGEAKAIEQTVNEINLYIPEIKDKTIDLSKSDKNEDFAQKPDITTTDNREARDKEAKKQLALAKYAERRAVLTREKQRINASNSENSTETAANNINSYRDSNTYAYGFCTWYAAQRRPDLPNRLGNGGAWLSNAQKLGLSTGSEPRTGAVMVTRESWAGHVSYVESVDGSNVTISEMNFRGWNRISTRTVDKNSAIIKGFIY